MATPTSLSVKPGREGYKILFDTVEALSKAAASPYKFVSDWFIAQFPDYDKAPTFKDGKLTAVPAKIPNIKDYKIKKTTKSA